eukprot:m.120879 g.120879  ORF g.120879 m.120879 type:complete len:231 (+) comp37741_c0_seq33:1684-2376(+)
MTRSSKTAQLVMVYQGLGLNALYNSVEPVYGFALKPRISLFDTDGRYAEEGPVQNILYRIIQVQKSLVILYGGGQWVSHCIEHDPDSEIGVFVVDRWTYYTLQFLEKVTPASKATVGGLFRSYDVRLVRSTPMFKTNLFERHVDKVLITDFFGSVRNIQLTSDPLVNVLALPLISRDNNTLWNELIWSSSEDLADSFDSDDNETPVKKASTILLLITCNVLLIVILCMRT